MFSLRWKNSNQYLMIFFKANLHLRLSQYLHHYTIAYRLSFITVASVVEQFKISIAEQTVSGLNTLSQFRLQVPSKRLYKNFLNPPGVNEYPLCWKVSLRQTNFCPGVDRHRSYRFGPQRSGMITGSMGL